MAEINSIDRLQFRHHSEVVSGECCDKQIPHDEHGVFTGNTLEEARANAIGYISGMTNGEYIKYSMWAQGEAGCGDNLLGHSLYGEPTVVKYRSTEPEIENEIHLLLAIGMATNNTDCVENNFFCIIDIDKTEQEIADLWEEIEKIIKSLSIIPIDTDSLDLEADWIIGEGIYLSGNVKTADRHIFELEDGEQTEPKKNSLMISPSENVLGNKEGLFIYVNLEYDKEHESFKFTRSLYDGTLESTTVELPNDYVISGVYKIEDESIHLRRKQGGEVVIDCKELIYEWDVAPSGSTPIVLKRERVKYVPLPHHKHSDILSADIMIDESRPYNILKRNSINSAVYVDGHAKNIAYDWNGEQMTVNDALNDLKKIRISPDRSNIIQDRADGFFANTTLDFISSENQLVFRTTNVDGTIKEKILQLNTVEVPIDDIYYDARTETLIIKWRNDKGEIQTLKIPIGDMINEWEVLNPGHNVHLNKVRSIGGNDKLSADVNIYNGENNILVDRDHSLYVKGTADNIKYKNTTVEGALDALDEKIDDETERAKAAEQALQDAIDAETERAEDEEARLQGEIDAVSANTIVSLKKITSDDNSVIVTTTEASGPQQGKDVDLSVNLSEEVEDNKPNLIKLNADGLYAGVDLLYDFNPEVGTNNLIFKTTDTTKVIELKTQSVIDKIYYDPNREAIIIEYTVDGHRMPDVVVPVGDLINEWRVEDGHPHAVQLEKVRVPSGTTEQDVLKASVIITEDHDDNILVMDDGALYVPANTDVTRALSAAIETEREERINADRDLEDEIQAEATARQLADAALSAFTITAVNEEKTRAMTAEGELRQAIQDETARANAADQLLQDAIDDEVSRSTAKDDEHDAKIAALEISANTLNSDIIAERTRALSAETALDTKINDERTRAENAEGTLETTLTAKINQTATILSAYTQTAVNDEKTRALTAENELRQAIVSETERANAADQVLSGAIVTERERALLIESQLHDAITAESATREAKDNELSDKIDAATLTFEDTTSINFNDPPHENNVVKAEVKIANATDNMILIDASKDGIYASAHLSYVTGTNTLTFTTSAGITETFQLAGATVIDNMYYDDYTGELVITYHDGSGNVQTVRFPVAQLFNEWIVQNPSTNSAIKLTKTPAAEQGAPDELSAQALITDDFNGDGKPDPGSDNLIQIRNNGLYVCGSGITEAQEIAECISGKTDAIYEILYDRAVPAGCGENIVYEPDRDACIISGATSFYDADRLLNNELCHLLSFWVSGMTCTSLSYWLDEGLNRTLQVDVRASRGNEGRMTDEDIYITNVTGKTIEHGVNEFTDTNVLRMVCLTEGGGGIIPAVESPANGMYLSNIWDCGKYYDLTNPSDVAEREEVEADGYNVDYFTDDSSAGGTPQYDNYLRQDDI